MKILFHKGRWDKNHFCTNRKDVNLNRLEFRLPCHLLFEPYPKTRNEIKILQKCPGCAKDKRGRWICCDYGSPGLSSYRLLVGRVYQNKHKK